MASVYQPEPSVEDVIGDATWRPASHASLWFVKNNVLVYVMDGSLLHNQLALTRAVARKIETKINAVLEKNENTDSLKVECAGKHHWVSSAPRDNNATRVWGFL